MRFDHEMTARSPGPLFLLRISHDMVWYVNEIKMEIKIKM